jgi:alanine racemase
MRIGTLHLGFYDGIPREMSNKGKVLVDGQIKQSLGSVSLNHYLVDLTGVEAEKGTEVTVIAEEGENSLYKTAETAGWMEYREGDSKPIMIKTNSSFGMTYSILNHINPLLPRVYFSKGEPIAIQELSNYL